ncbi:uncharacterized protein PV07_02238 [Cladophialophora immunda]|uniref:Fe2OG dioxygenase domain-containing protein n=1 Tax=Cladophialophora immunda TaxID=569365 RepID=A0A0D2CWV4_9EURO|nr:uncharacterized protein PV07_02238 [Cladophialophora immunda]KIW35548.1 hypothetical protein PV07_02238 [Cladophialophora immunda]OQV04833.1 hypothetical protein CLAIMM_09657 [Cladophialophora immunda]
MATQTQVTTSRLKALGAAADINQNANLAKFTEPSADDEYDNAVQLIESKLDKMAAVDALFTVNLGSNHPGLLVDARNSGRATMSQITDRQQCDLESCSADLYVRPHMIQRFVDGVMDARYALNWGHIFAIGATRVAIKFVDVLTSFEAIHPKLDPSIIDKLPRPTEDVGQVKADLSKWGYGFVKNALSPEELQKLQKRLKDQARGEAEAGVGFFDGGETMPNQRLWCLHNKGQEFIDLLDHNKVLKQFLPPHLGDDAILFSYTANIARPGNSPMYLHTDQLTIQPPIRNINFGLNFMFFLTDITAENGGTLVMPGSHTGNFAPDDPYDVSDCVAAEGPAGTCMVFESRLWHATGPNRTPGSERPVIIVFFMRPFIRPQENFFFSLRPGLEENLSDRVKGFLGYRSTGSIGGVEGKTKDGTFVKKLENPVGILGGESVPLN